MASRKLVPGFGWHITLEGLDPVIVYYDFLNRIAEAASIYSAKLNHTTHAKINQAVDSHEYQKQCPAERNLSRLALINNTPLAAYIAMFKG